MKKLLDPRDIPRIKNTRYRLLCLALAPLLMLASHYSAPAQKMSFARIVPTEAARWEGSITGITQDRQGFIWFSTDYGLYQYDGYQVIPQEHNLLSINSVTGGNFETVYADQAGIIWIGTRTAGLVRFDPATGLYTQFIHHPEDTSSLSSNYVTVMLEDHSGTFWVGSRGGLNRLDKKTGKFVRYQHNPQDFASLSDDQVQALYEDRQGTLWIGTGNRELLADEGGLNRLDRKTGKFVRYLHDPKNSSTLINNKVRAIFEDSRGTFWVGTHGDGLHTMDRNKGTFERHTYDPAHPEKLSKPPFLEGNSTEGVSCIQEDGSGNIWIGDVLNGLNRYDPVKRQITYYGYNSTNADGLQDDFIRVAFTSRDGILFIGSAFGNLYRVNPFQSQLPYFPLYLSVFAFHEESSGLLWLGTDKGLILQDRRTGNRKFFVHDPAQPSSLSHDVITALQEDRQGILWVGTDNGLDRFDSKTQTFTHYQHREHDPTSLSHQAVTTIFEDRSGNLWVGTPNGLDRLERRTGTFTHYRSNPGDSASHSNNWVRCLLEDRQGNLWVGTDGTGGLNRFDRTTGQFKSYSDVSHIVKVIEDADGKLWLISGGAGLYSFDPKTELFLPFEDSQLGRITGLWNVIQDDQRNLWLCTSSVLIRINPAQDGHKTYRMQREGIQVSSSIVTYKGRKGELFFGDQIGYFAFFPDRLLKSTIPPQIILKDFRFADDLVKPGKRRQLNGPFSSDKSIELDYSQNGFAIDFAGIHYGNPEQNEHLFQLEGYDNAWRRVGVEKTAYYYNVPPGHYLFRVKATNSDGVWAQNAFPIIIFPPWWRTWWAYVLYTLTFFGTVWGFIEYRSSRLRREKRLLEQRVNERTAEVLKQKEEILDINEELSQQKEEIAAQRDQVSKTLEELQATQTQLIQSEKMASLGELTAAIAHEIQNPLNFVKNFSEVSEELISELLDELDAGDTQDAKSLSEDIKQNLQKIQHHSKRADAIVKGMLQHSRASGSEKQLTDINALAEEYLRLAYHGIKSKDQAFNTSLVTDFDPGLGIVEVVPQEIGRVLLNLFNNAFYAIREKKQKVGQDYQPKVQVRTKRLNGRVEIYVRDNGIGVPENVKQKIFQPFFTTKPTGQGTGLGLSLSYDIITKGHGGELRVETVAGEFTEFIIRLPFDK